MSNFAELAFTLFCRKDVKWGITTKSKLSPEDLLQRQNVEFNDFWRRFKINRPEFRQKIIVDYGCGFGYDSLFCLQNGASFVYCLEISETRLKYSRELHQSHGFFNAAYIRNSIPADLSKLVKDVDLIYCRDVMEHVPDPKAVLESMYSILKPSGEVYIGFSPLFKSPYGAHISTKCKLPYSHLIFSEKTILKVFNKLYDLKANSFLDIEGSGVNKLSYYHFQQLLEDFNWNKEINEINQFRNHKIVSALLNALLKLLIFNSLKELFIISTYVKLKKHLNFTIESEVLK